MKLITGKERWYVVQSFTGNEQDVADELRKCGIDAYFPRYKQEVRRKHGFSVVERPALPGYLFVAQPDNPIVVHRKKHVHWQKRTTDIDGVIGFLKNQGDLVRIDGSIVVEIQVREMNAEFDKMITDKDGKEMLREKFPIRSKAEIQTGPFAMMIGEVTKHLKTGQLTLKVDVHGKAFLTNEDPAKLRPAA
jgi:transcription antitermination factor NusG